METVLLQQKINQLPDSFIFLVNNYVDELLEKSKKISSLKGSLSNYSNNDLRKKEKEAWKNQLVRKHNNV